MSYDLRVWGRRSEGLEGVLRSEDGWTQRPVVGFSVADCDAEPHPQLGFRSNRFQLELVLGPPYRDLWPLDSVQRHEGLCFSETGDWCDGVPLHVEVPADLAQPWQREWVEVEAGGRTIDWRDEYPATWPFGT